MLEKQPFAERSYRSHEQHISKQIQKEGDPLLRLVDLESINAWRHERMYRLLEPLLSWPGSWLTVGDGIGTDANWLQRRGVQEVVASDIGDALLKEAQKRGFIRAYRQENAERIQLANGTFDYALCKEAYHHFPRPYLAIYEMLRVSQRAVILIEPQDPIQKMPILHLMKNVLDRISPKILNRIWKNQYSFEVVGNYVYKISEREVEKVAMGMGLPAVAFCGLNDYFSEHEEMSSIPPNKRFFRAVKRKLMFRNFLCRLGLIPYRLLFCIIFKEPAPQNVLEQLKAKGFKYTTLPENPYVSTS